MTDAPDDDADIDTFAPDQAPVMLRGEPVLLAGMVASAFGVTTREVTQAIKRNPEKFQQSHAFELTPGEVEVLRSQGVISKSGRGGSRALPWGLTQKGIARLATIISSPQALAATDLIIDIFVEVHRQVARGSTEIAITRPSRLAGDPDQADAITRLQRRFMDAMDHLMDMVIDPQTQATIRDELGAARHGLLDHLKATLSAKGIENEKVQAETLLILEQVQDLRERRAADLRYRHLESDQLHLDNIGKRIDLLKQMMAMARDMEPNAIATLFDTFRDPSLPVPASAAEMPRLGHPTSTPTKD
ncbi:ORF6N domain protein [Asticcacaulis biprosthecium C19]|uniref:ORF6N domain protein n=1 Tax=Asticcacaulis biprosthecium C19 TaxID=715226 RepID=F4QP31_9CAUL|nr:ORF6N domain-containing protein [Asticcacaulis biprosthecium]EGF91089.1 ORF6N domain protein [Asticcacaulis biprosthecium C19]